MSPRITDLWSTVVVVESLAIAAIPMLLLDARANDGAASMTALFGIPMVALAVLIVLRQPRDDSRPFVGGLLPWVGGLVLGMLFLGIAAAVREPEYYESETQGGLFAVLGAFLVIMALGLGAGIVLWLAVGLPVAALAAWLGRAWRQEPTTPRQLAVPAGVLAVEAIIVVIVVAMNGDPDELVVAQIGAVLLGIPLGPLADEPPPELAVWILRGIVVVVPAIAAALTVMWRDRAKERGSVERG